MIYQLIVLIVAAVSVLWGFRRGFTRQLPSIIGMAFGIISARLLAPALTELMYGTFPSVHGKVEEKFVYDTISSTIIFTSVYYIFKTLTLFVGKILRREDRTIVDNLGGAIFCLFKYLFAVSLVFNLLIALNRNSNLLMFVKSDDGNIVEVTLLLSPSLLGSEDAEELSHRIQLEEARKIS